MGNRLFEDARQAVELAKNCGTADVNSMISKAQNAISSAHANTTIAEQHQLAELQQELDQLKTH